MGKISGGCGHALDHPEILWANASASTSTTASSTSDVPISQQLHSRLMVEAKQGIGISKQAQPEVNGEEVSEAVFVAVKFTCSSTSWGRGRLATISFEPTSEIMGSSCSVV